MPLNLTVNTEPFLSRRTVWYLVPSLHWRMPDLKSISAQPDAASPARNSATGRKKYHRYLDRLESKRRKDWDLDGCLVRNEKCQCKVY